MKKVLAAVAVALLGAGEASARGIDYVSPRTETLFLYGYVNGAAAVTYNHSGRKILRQAVTITGLETMVTGASGGGAGVTTFRLYDGTRTCTMDVLCTASQSTGIKSASAPTGSCTFPVGSTVELDITTAGCTTTQPTLRWITVTAEVQS